MPCQAQKLVKAKDVSKVLAPCAMFELGCMAKPWFGACFHGLSSVRVGFCPTPTWQAHGQHPDASHHAPHAAKADEAVALEPLFFLV